MPLNFMSRCHPPPLREHLSARVSFIRSNTTHHNYWELPYRPERTMIPYEQRATTTIPTHQNRYQGTLNQQVPAGEPRRSISTDSCNATVAPIGQGYEDLEGHWSTRNPSRFRDSLWTSDFLSPCAGDQSSVQRLGVGATSYPRGFSPGGSAQCAEHPTPRNFQ